MTHTHLDHIGCLAELEKEFASSNLWRCVVAQRTHSDYSYLGGSFAYSKYPLDEIEFFLKSVVLFYRDIIHRRRIELAIAHAPDVIHSRVLYELALSMPFVAINQFYDAYWGGGSRYMVDEISFSSSLIRQRYRSNMERYETAILPKEKELEENVSQCLSEDPRHIYTPENWPTTLSGSFKTAFLSFLDRRSDFQIFKPDIIQAYYLHHLRGKIKAWLLRIGNLASRKAFIRFASELPRRPYVFFGPNYQPESTTLASSPVWSDMLAIIRILSVSLPSGYQLVVKDHPMIGGNRPTYFYRQVMDLPNTVLLPEKYPTLQVIKKSSMVSTLTGTVGFQALMRDKPLLLFGHVYYDCIDGILRPPADLNDFPLMLKDVLVNGNVPAPAERRRALLAFMEAYRSAMVHNDKMANPKNPDEQGEGLAELIDHWIRVDLEEIGKKRQAYFTAGFTKCGKREDSVAP